MIRAQEGRSTSCVTYDVMLPGTVDTRISTALCRKLRPTAQGYMSFLTSGLECPNVPPTSWQQNGSKTYEATHSMMPIDEESGRSTAS